MTEYSAPALAAAARAVVALARRPAGMLSEWRRLAGQLDGTVAATSEEWRPDSSTAIEIDSRAARIRIDSLRGALHGRRRGLLMRVRAQSLDPDAPRVLVVSSEVPLPGRVPPRVEVPDLHGYAVRADRRARDFSPALVTAIADAQPTWLERTRGEVALYWKGWHAAADRTAAALTAVEALATEEAALSSQGPYR